jgi:hypothetical protein
MIQRHPFGIRERSVGVSGFRLGHCGIIDVSMPKAGPCQPVLRLGRPLARFGLEDLPGRGRRLLRMGGPRRPASASNAHVNRQPPNSAALPFPRGSHSLGRCCHGSSPPSGMVHAKAFPRRDRPKGRGALGCHRRRRRETGHAGGGDVRTDLHLESD